MKNKWRDWTEKLLKYIILTGFWLLILVAPHRINSSCTPVQPGRTALSFLSKDWVRPDAAYARLFRTAGGWEDAPGLNQRQETANLLEWQERFCQDYDTLEIKQVIYQTTTFDLEALIGACQSNALALPPRLTLNGFADHLVREKCIDVARYLLFAKQCEPHVTAPADAWQVTPPPDTTAMQELIREGRRQFRDAKSHYVRLRYTYQLIRLAHYARNYRQVLGLYEDLMPKFSAHASIVHQWIEGHRAGALLALGERVQAAYLFAKVFMNSSEKRVQAFRSFQLKNDEEWEACNRLCESDAERATLHVIRGFAQRARVLEEMQAVYGLDPGNVFLEGLLLRMLESLESSLLKGTRQEQNLAGSRLIDLRAFVDRVLKDQTVPRLNNWRVADVYLQWLAGDVYKAKDKLARLQQSVKDPALQEQLDMTSLALQLADWDVMSDTLANDLYRLRRDHPLFKKYPAFHQYLMERLSEGFQRQGRPGLAFLCRYRLADLKMNPQMELVDDLILACRQRVKNRWEEWLLQGEDGLTIEPELLDLKASWLLAQFEPDAALRVYNEMPEFNWDDFGVFGPFADPVNDCVRCPLPDSVIMYNKVDLIEEMLDLEIRAKAASSRNGLYYYRLGLAWYNITYFGEAWQVLDAFRSSASAAKLAKRTTKETGFSYPGAPFGNRANMACSTAQIFFERARQVADSPELAAKAAFMAAKCEQNYYYLNRTLYESKPRTFFALLKNQFGQTAYYQRAVQECKYLEHFNK